jgi:ribosomal protein S27E
MPKYYATQVYDACAKCMDGIVNCDWCDKPLYNATGGITHVAGRPIKHVHKSCAVEMRKER